VALGDYDSRPGLQSMVGAAYSAAAGMPFDPSFWEALPWELRMLLQRLARCVGGGEVPPSSPLLR